MNDKHLIDDLQRNHDSLGRDMSIYSRAIYELQNMERLLKIGNDELMVRVEATAKTINDGLVLEIHRLEKDNADLRAKLLAAADRIAAQSELLSKRVERSIS